MGVIVVLADRRRSLVEARAGFVEEEREEAALEGGKGFGGGKGGEVAAGEGGDGEGAHVCVRLGGEGG